MVVAMSENSIETLTKLLTGLGALFGAILALLGPLRGIWRKILKPISQFVIATSTLVIPNGLIIGGLLYRVARYYWEAGRPEFLITNPAVLAQLVILQAGLVSLYSFLWSQWAYPRLRPWFGAKSSPPSGSTLPGGTR